MKGIYGVDIENFEIINSWGLGMSGEGEERKGGFNRMVDGSAREKFPLCAFLEVSAWWCVVSMEKK